MKKRMILAAGLMLLLIGSSAAAEKARFLAEDGDRAYHGRHLALHAGTEDCRICGNYLKVRARPDGNAAVVGHAEQADLVRLLEISGNWARIRVVYSAQSSPDSWTGLEGWVDAAYLECGCSERTYYAGGVEAAQGGEITAGAVNLRETPSAKSRSLGKLERGERVRVLGQYGKGAKTFYRVVRTSGQSGFVSAEYLKVGGSVPGMNYATGGNVSTYPSSERTSGRTSSLQACIGTESVQATTGQLRVREKPNGEITGHISPDDRILLEEISGIWARITVTQAKSWYEDCWTGLTGWVSTEYLNTINGSNAGNKADIIQELTDYKSWDEVLNAYYEAVGDAENQIYDKDINIETYNKLKFVTYLFKDIDRDGVDELIFLEDDEIPGIADGFGGIVALFTKKSGRIYHVVDGWARSAFYLRDDNSLYYSGAGGAAYSVEGVYILQKDWVKLKEAVFQ